jgi:predicted dehydrogenase
VTDRLRVGIIGAGYGQHVQVPAFRGDDRVSVDILCASTEARARVIADRLGVLRASGDWREVVNDPQIDVVAISVPPALQSQIVLAAAAAGKHILAEKPLGMTLSEAQAMASAVREAGVVGAVDFEFRELEAWRRFRDLLAVKAIGPLRQVYFSWRIETVAYRDNKVSWKRDASLGGGALNLFGSHALDFILWSFGPVRRLTAQLVVPGPGTADARAEAWLEMVDGPPVSLSIAADTPLGSGFRVEAYGEGGSLVLENLTSDYAAGFTLAMGTRSETMRAVDLPPLPSVADGRVTAASGLVRRFVDAIVSHSPMNPDFEDGLRVQQLIDAIRAADRLGTWQTLS